MKNRIALIVALALPAAAFGQSFNVDLDTLSPEVGGGVPSSSFGAAANQPGVWNSISVIDGANSLFDLNGVVRPVSIILGSSSPFLSGGGFNNQENTGDFAKLLNDEGSVDSDWRTWTFQGLTNGTYRVTTYAVRPFPTFVQARVSVNGGAEAIATGPMPGNQFIIGKTHVTQMTTVSSGSLEIRVARLAGTPSVAVNGFQITLLPATTTVAPIGYQVVNGFNFGGTLASLINSDNDRVIVLCDSDDSLGEIHFFSNLPQGSLSELKFKLEGRATRTDLSQLVDMYNYRTGQFANVHFRVTTLFDTVVEGSITNGVADFVDPAGEVKSRVLWIPSQDLVAFDGWTQSVDHVVWTMVH